MVNMDLDAAPPSSAAALAGPGPSRSLPLLLTPLPPPRLAHLAHPLCTRATALDDLFKDDNLAAMLPQLDNATEESMGDLSNPMVMRTYYSRLLPWKAMFLWLNQSHGASPSSLRPSRARTR